MATSPTRRRRGGRNPQAKVQAKFFEISRKAASFKEIDTGKPSALSKMIADKHGDSGPLLPQKKKDLDKAIKLYTEALELYREKVVTKNPSYFAGAYQNLGTTLMEARQYDKAEENMVEAEKISFGAGLTNSINHASILDNMVVLYIKTRAWEKAERAAADSLRFFPEDAASHQKAGLKILDKQARHARLCTMVGGLEKLQEAIKLCSIVLEKSSNKKVRKAQMNLIQSIAKSQVAMLTRDEELLQDAETQMSHSIGLAERGYGKSHSATADHCEYCSMFQGAIRKDYKVAEIMALKAADCREGHLAHMLKEEVFAQQKGGVDDKDFNYIKVDVLKDPRCRLLLEECLAMLGNVKAKRFLMPQQYLRWKGF